MNKIKRFINVISGVSHQGIGLAYICGGVLLGFSGYWFSSLIRFEICFPGYTLLSGSENTYNIIISMHGLIMIFFFVVPTFINGLGNYFVPIMIGTKDMAMPRLNNFGLLLFFMSAILLELTANGIFKETGVATGWTLYPPLSLTSSVNLDFLILSLHVNGASSLLNSINTIITIQFLSSNNKWHYNLFIWSMLITSYLLIFVLPILVSAITALLTDHILGTCFFSVSSGGDPLLFQHLFWFFGHPEVYILILPVFGLVGELICEFGNIRLNGDKVMVWSMLAISFLGSLVWGHHMFTAGLDIDTKCYFTAASLVIAIPTGLKIFIWITSLIGNKIDFFNLPTMFIIAFIKTFMFGGITGIILAQNNLDLVLHDTYFVIGHFHYILAMSLIYIGFASIYSYYYLLTGIHYNKTFGHAHYYTFLVGSNLTFLPTHFIGLSGMPRRVLDYPSPFTFWNYVSTYGFILMLISVVWFLLALVPYNIILIKINKILDKTLHSRFWRIKTMLWIIEFWIPYCIVLYIIIYISS